MKRGRQLSSLNKDKSSSGKNFPWILDGAMGSYLQKSGYQRHPVLWFSHLNIDAPDAVIAAHSENIHSGAEIITTNTFRTNPSAAENVSAYDCIRLTKSAVDNAFIASGEKDIIVAGSNPPAEDSYQAARYLSFSQLEYNHKKHIELLHTYGCHFILNETQSHFDEIKIICEFCSENQIKFIISLFFDQKFCILSGEKIDEVIQFTLDYDPLAVCFNCISIPLFRSFIKSDFNFKWGFYLNYGLGNTSDEKIESFHQPGSEEDIITEALRKNVLLIGGCCGSGPEHIRSLKSIIYGKYNT